MDATKKIKIVDELCGIFQKPTNDGLYASFSRMLEKLTQVQIDLAFEKIETNWTSPFIPRPAEFFQMATTGEGFINYEQEAPSQWTVLRNAQKFFSFYHSVCFQNPAIAEWIRQEGGWVKIGKWMEDEMVYRNLDFLKDYPVLRRKQKNDNCPFVIGQIDIDNWEKRMIGKSPLQLSFSGNFTVEEQQKTVLSIRKQFALEYVATGGKLTDSLKKELSMNEKHKLQLVHSV